MKYWVYRFLNLKNEIIYVGKSKNIKERMNCHFGTSGHLPQECYRKTVKIEYAICESKTQMDIYEIYYINKFKPFYNTVDKNDEEDMIMQLPEKQWFVYNDDNEDYNNKIIQDYEKIFYENEILKKENVELKESLKSTNCEKSEDENKIPYSFTLKEIIEIYRNCKSETLEFYSKWIINNELCYDMVIYYKDNKIYFKDKQATNTYNEDNNIYYDFTNEKEPLFLYTPLFGKFYPSTKTGYLVQAKILQEKIDYLKPRISKIYTIEDVINDKERNRYYLKRDTDLFIVPRDNEYFIRHDEADIHGEFTKDYLLENFKEDEFINEDAYSRVNDLIKFNSELLEVSLAS